MKVEDRQAGEAAREYAYRILKDNITALILEPGSTLNDMEISQRIGISRTPVREAIMKLKEESGIIEIFPQRGMRIALIDTEIVQEVRFLRMVLEKALAESACDMAQKEDFVWLEENLTLQEFYLKNNLFQKFLSLDNALHHKLFTICHKELIYRMSQGLSIHYDRVRNMEAAAIHNNKVLEDHRKLIDALRKKDKELAKKIMEEHLDRWLVNEKTLRREYPQYFKSWHEKKLQHQD